MKFFLNSFADMFGLTGVTQSNVDDDEDNLNTTAHNSLERPKPSDKQITDQQLLSDFMHLKPSQSTTSIEFNQVFTLPLGEVFNAAYNYARGKGLTPTTSRATTPTVPAVQSSSDDDYTRHIKVDIRPKKWHRIMKSLNTEIEITQLDLDFNRKQGLAALNNLKSDSIKSDDYMKTRNDYDALLIKQRKIDARLNELKDAKNTLLREIRLNNYTYSDENTDLKIFKRYENAPLSTILNPQQIACYFGAGKDPNEPDKEGNDNWRTVYEALEKTLNTKDKKLCEKFIMERKKVDEDCINLSTDTVARVQHSELKEQYESARVNLQSLANRIKHISDSPRTHGMRGTDSENTFGTFTIDLKVFILMATNPEHYPTLTELASAISRFLESHIYPQIIDKQIYICEESLKRRPAQPKMTDRRQAYKNILSLIDCYNQKRYGYNFSSLKLNSNIEIHDRRREFLKKWLQVRLTSSLKTTPIQIDVDPVIQCLDELTKMKSVSSNDDDNNRNDYQHYRFYLTPQGFYNSDGNSLQDFMSRPASELRGTILTLPYFEKDGSLSEDVYQVVVNPTAPGKYDLTQWPVIKFVETPVLTISWAGFSLAEVTHSSNLFPGEQKSIWVEHQTKKTKSINSSSKNAADAKQYLTSSFDENLQNALSKATNTTHSDQEMRKSNQSMQQNNKMVDERATDVREEHREGTNASRHNESEGGGRLFIYGFRGQWKGLRW